MFGAAFGGIYLPGTLHKPIVTKDARGSATAVAFADHPMRYQSNGVSRVFNADTGVVQLQASFLILQASCPAPVEVRDEFTTGEGRFVAAGSASDPARSHWIVSAVPA